MQFTEKQHALHPVYLDSIVLSTDRSLCRGWRSLSWTQLSTSQQKTMSSSKYLGNIKKFIWDWKLYILNTVRGPNFALAAKLQTTEEVCAQIAIQASIATTPSLTPCPHTHTFLVIEIYNTCSISRNSWTLRKQHRYVFAISDDVKIIAFMNPVNSVCIFQPIYQEKFTNQLISYSETHHMPNYIIKFDDVVR